MQISLPVYVKVVKGDVEKKSVYRTQLLFYPQHVSENAVLQRGVTKLGRQVRKLFSNWGKSWNQRGLVNVSFNPAGLRQTTAKFEFMLKSRVWRCKYFIATFPAFDRHVAFCPDLPDVWFEYESGELQSRAAEVYEAYFRQIFKDDDRAINRTPPTSFNVESKRWLTWIDVQANIDQISEDENARKMMALWTNSSVNGEVELERVGRCLDWQYPDDLDRSYCRDSDAEHLRRTMEMPDRRPVMLLGDSLCGKTALIHEVVSRRVEDRQMLIETTTEKVDRSQNNVWLLSPQRLISGMSYVGQWEERVHAILEAAEKKNLTLYFDDPIGLFRAGKSSCSSLCVADLLRKPLQDRRVRVLCEMTNAGYEQLLNLDRSFADLFHVIRIAPLSEQDTLKVAIEVSRKIEHDLESRFEPDVLPTVIRLQRQYVGHASFPGKAVRFLKQLGVKYPAQQIQSANAVAEMAETCGISLPLVDNQQTLASKDVRHEFQQQIVGQDAAVNTCVDLVLTQKAKLVQPGKPMMTMLFTGPTGVGKTETAKALANYLFRDSEKLVRFDLNEFKTGYSAARLVGTIDQPEGLLTSAIRHRPYSVILFDEVEKGHPDVFDVLLQVLGEGRLTDALGRTTDFSNTIIVMTSNLGASEAGSKVGFMPADDERHYIAAAEKFFRPEFFNRIDRVVPFHSLNRQQIASIADRMMQSVVAREGLMRRRCVLDVGPGLISDVVDVGYDQAMGARGLKRAIERHFTHPVAAKLANIRSTTPTLITVRKKTGSESFNMANGTAEKLDVDVVPLLNAEPIGKIRQFENEADLVDAASQFVDRIEAEKFSERPPGEISGSGMSPELLRHFSLVETANEIRELIASLKTQSGKPSPSHVPALPVSRGRKSVSDRERGMMDDRVYLQQLAAADDIAEFVGGSGKARSKGAESAQERLIGECRSLAANAESLDTEVILYLNPSDPDRFRPRGLKSDTKTEDSGNAFDPYSFAYRGWLNFLDFECALFDFEVEGKFTRFIHVAGGGVMATIGKETGYVLMTLANGRIGVLESGCIKADYKDFGMFRDAILNRDASGIPSGTSVDQLRSGESLRVLRVIDSQKVAVDFRSGVRDAAFLDFEKMTLMHRGSLPLPQEFREEKLP